MSMSLEVSVLNFSCIPVVATLGGPDSKEKGCIMLLTSLFEALRLFPHSFTLLLFWLLVSLKALINSDFYLHLFDNFH